MGIAASREGAPDGGSSAYRRYVLVVLLLIYTCHFIDRTIVAVLAEPIRIEFGLSDSELGLLTGLAYGASFALAGIPLGLLIDRFNRRNILAGILIIWSGLTALSGMAQSFAGLIAARMGVGAAESGGSPAAMSILADIFPPEKRASAAGLFFLSAPLGLLISNAIGGLIAGEFGWRAAFFAAGAPGFLLAVLLVLTVREPKRGAAEPAPVDEVAPGLLETLRFILSHRALSPLLFAMMAFAFCSASMAAFIVAFLMRHHALPIAEAGLSFALAAGVCGGAGAVLGGFVSDRMARKAPRAPYWLLCGAACLATPCCIVMVTASPLPVALAAMMAWQACAAFYLGPSYGLAMSLAPLRMRGAAVSILQVGTNFIGYGTGPFLTGALSDLYAGPEALRHSLITMSGLYLLAALLFALAARGARTETGRRRLGVMPCGRVACHVGRARACLHRRPKAIRDDRARGRS